LIPQDSRCMKTRESRGLSGRECESESKLTVWESEMSVTGRFKNCTLQMAGDSSLVPVGAGAAKQKIG